MVVYPAHIRVDAQGKKHIQTVTEHSRAAAEHAGAVSDDCLKNTVSLAGLLHDMGKTKDEFRLYLETVADGKPLRRGSVNHSFSAPRFIMERWYTPHKPSIENLTCEILAFATGAHHGLFDCVSPDGSDGFSYRLSKEGIQYEESTQQYLSTCISAKEIDHRFAKVVEEIGVLFPKIRAISDVEETMFFHLSLLAKYVLSCVIDGDRRDTAHFMLKIPPFDVSHRMTSERWQERLQFMEQKQRALPLKHALDYIRRDISDQCRGCADKSTGIYRLNVPTGGGKTLTSLRFSLAHAALHNKKRIFFITPLLGVLDQNATVLREFIGDEAMILECHSNLLQESDSLDTLHVNELLDEAWDAPVIITTLVQFLNTLFGGKTKNIRRLHSLANSVIIIDEVQTAPRKMLSLFTLAMNFLSEICGATIVLCSATQPTFDSIRRPIRYQSPADLVPEDSSRWKSLLRTKIVNKCRPEGYTTREAADFASNLLPTNKSVLFVCNTKAQARAIFKSVRAITTAQVFHLSASMCMAHRRYTLAQIKRCLEENEPMICISTQLVEAGIDFSFSCAIRVLAGLDNILQTAGRCNRNGEFGKLCPVYIINLQGENLANLRDIEDAQVALRSVLSAYGEALTSQEAISAYYQKLYKEMPEGAQDYSVPSENTTLFSLLSDNRPSLHRTKADAPARHYLIRQAFKTAGKVFQVFEKDTTDILVPFGKGAEIIKKLSSDEANHDLAYRKALLKEAKPYVVSIFDYELQRLLTAGGCSLLFDASLLVLHPDFYSMELGLTISANN